jgi:hypothetical protein
MSKPKRKKSQFKQATDQTRAQYYHDCDPGQKPYATVSVVSTEKTTIMCPLCGHIETHHSLAMP